MGLVLIGESFEVVDGPYKGKTFVRGKTYAEAEVPPNEKKRFKQVKDRPKKADGPEAAPDKSVPQAASKKSGASENKAKASGADSGKFKKA